MTPDYNRLKVFYHIYRHKSVATAAKELHVTQSAVSQHLQKLEAEINASLFIRSHKRLLPTIAGERLFAIVLPFVNKLEEGLATIRQEQELPSGTLRIGAPVEFGERYLIEIFSSFKNQYPLVSFYLELGHPSILLPMIREGQLDAAFADIFTHQGEFNRDLAIYHIETVFEEELIMVGSKEYLKEAIKEDLTFNNLGKKSFVSYQKHTPALHNWFRHHFGKTNSRLKVCLTVESVRGVMAGIRQHMGLGLIPSHLVKNEIAAGDLIAVKPSKKQLVNNISLVQLQDKVPSITEKTFLEYCKSTIINSEVL